MELESRDVRSMETPYSAGLRAGLAAISPLLLAVAPFSMALSVAAHSAGLSTFEIISMSVFVFAGAAQMAAISMYAGGAGLIAIVLTTFLMNLRHIIYGFSLDRHLPAVPQPSRSVLAFFLVDESYGMAVARAATQPRIDAFYLGISLGLYATYVLFTAVGAVFASLIPEINQIGLDFIFPLAFVGLLLPLLTDCRKIAIALASGSLAAVFLQLTDPGIAIILAISGGAMAGTVWKEQA
jgi:4-azaleucine resistance transporter AzlC